MSLIETLGLAVLHRVDPERAHGLSLRALQAGLVPLPGVITSARLATSVAGLALPNPVGLAAGYDKNAVALAPLSRSGFGFIEVGAATPRPQPGNPQPRLFRLTEDRAAINRFGFNNEGAEAIGVRLAARQRGAVFGHAVEAGELQGEGQVGQGHVSLSGQFCRRRRRCAPPADGAPRRPR